MHCVRTERAQGGLDGIRDSCKQCLSKLPLTNIVKALSALLEDSNRSLVIHLKLYALLIRWFFLVRRIRWRSPSLLRVHVETGLYDQ
jgi:hypothetical protein